MQAFLFRPSNVHISKLVKVACNHVVVMLKQKVSSNLFIYAVTADFIFVRVLILPQLCLLGLGCFRVRLRLSLNCMWEVSVTPNVSLNQHLYTSRSRQAIETSYNYP